MLWTGLRTQLSDAARQYLRDTFPAVAVQAFTGTTEQYWQDWLSDDNLDRLSGLVVVLDGTGLPVAWVASNDRRFGGRRCFYANSAGVHPTTREPGSPARSGGRCCGRRSSGPPRTASMR